MGLGLWFLFGFGFGFGFGSVASVVVVAVAVAVARYRFGSMGAVFAWVSVGDTSAPRRTSNKTNPAKRGFFVRFGFRVVRVPGAQISSIRHNSAP